MWLGRAGGVGLRRRTNEGREGKVENRGIAEKKKKRKGKKEKKERKEEERKRKEK